MRAQEEAELAEPPRLSRTDFFAWPMRCLAPTSSHGLCGLRGSPSSAEDAVQSVWVSAYRTWPRVRDVQSTEAYLRKMVVNG